MLARAGIAAILSKISFLGSGSFLLYWSIILCARDVVAEVLLVECVVVVARAAFFPDGADVSVIVYLNYPVRPFSARILISGWLQFIGVLPLLHTV